MAGEALGCWEGHEQAEHSDGCKRAGEIHPCASSAHREASNKCLQVALEKFARYFEVEARILPVSAKSDYRLDPELVKKNIDENTIGVFVIMGSTYTGHYEPVEEIHDILDQFEKETGNDIPIHVDGASGAFIAPFSKYILFTY